MRTIFLFPTISEVPSDWLNNRKKGGTLSAIPSNLNAYFIITGMGRNIVPVVQSIEWNPEEDVAILAGCCGGLAKNLQTGDVTLCQKIIASGLPEIEVNLALCKKIMQAFSCLQPTHLVNGYTSENLVTSMYDKDKCLEKGAEIVEMENYWAVQILLEKKIPWICIRIVLDTYQDILPNLTNVISSNGDVSITNAIFWIFTHPRQFFQFLHLIALTRKIIPIWKTTLNQILKFV